MLPIMFIPWRWIGQIALLSQLCNMNEEHLLRLFDQLSDKIGKRFTKRIKAISQKLKKRMAYYLKKPINFDRLSCRSLFQMDFLTRMKDMNCVQYLGQTFILFLNIDACRTKKHVARQGYVRPFCSCALRLLFLGITIVIFT